MAAWNLTKEQVTSQLGQWEPEQLANLALGVLVLHDYMITLADEIELIWMHRRAHGTMIIFALNRLSVLVFVVGQILSTLNWMPSQIPGCIWAIIVSDIPLGLQNIVWAGFSTLRVYALTGGSKLPALLVFSLNISLVGMYAYFDGGMILSDTSIFAVSASFTLCVGGYNRSTEANVIVTCASSACVILADVIVLVITWRKTYRLRKNGRTDGYQTPVATMLLRDGTFYFLGNLITNAAQVVIMFAYPDMRLYSMLPLVMTFIIVSRFILNARRFSRHHYEMTTATTGVSHNDHPLSDLRFGSHFVTDMGSDLDGNLSFGMLQDEQYHEAEIGANGAHYDVDPGDIEEVLRARGT